VTSRAPKTAYLYNQRLRVPVKPRAPIKRPLKHKRYPLAKRRRMTIAAGFTSKDAVLICADTLISGGVVSSHQSKLGGYKFKDGQAIFAFAGHVDFAESAIQQCGEELRLHTGNPARTHSQIANIIRKRLASEYKTNVIDNGYVGTVYDYAIIVGLRSSVDGLGLYCTSQTTMKRSRRGFELTGEGESIALLAARRFGDYRSFKRISTESVSLLAAYVIGEAKRHQEGSCGGGSVILVIPKQGRIYPALDLNVPIIEQFATKFHHYSNFLLAMFLNLDSNQLSAELQSFPSAIADLREQYRVAAQSGLANRSAEAIDVMWELGE
jgi:hypothetical protein